MTAVSTARLNIVLRLLPPFSQSQSCHTDQKAVYKAVCISVLLYGCEACTPYRRYNKAIEDFRACSLQIVLGIDDGRKCRTPRYFRGRKLLRSSIRWRKATQLAWAFDTYAFLVGCCMESCPQDRGHETVSWWSQDAIHGPHQNDQIDLAKVKQYSRGRMLGSQEKPIVVSDRRKCLGTGGCAGGAYSCYLTTGISG